jgi:hypothetical protein
MIPYILKNGMTLEELFDRVEANISRAAEDAELARDDDEAEEQRSLLATVQKARARGLVETVSLQLWLKRAH